MLPTLPVAWPSAHRAQHPTTPPPHSPLPPAHSPRTLLACACAPCLLPLCDAQAVGDFGGWGGGGVDEAAEAILDLQGMIDLQGMKGMIAAASSDERQLWTGAGGGGGGTGGNRNGDNGDHGDHGDSGDNGDNGLEVAAAAAEADGGAEATTRRTAAQPQLSAELTRARTALIASERSRAILIEEVRQLRLAAARQVVVPPLPPRARARMHACMPNARMHARSNAQCSDTQCQ